jgi:hypothetical protein
MNPSGRWVIRRTFPGLSLEAPPRAFQVVTLAGIRKVEAADTTELFRRVDSAAVVAVVDLR